ncbi:MAG: hypothetical protein QOI74_1844, partial [Micromonosporaceae bacterium]|nr:hypothetical protein [Micromonosporaceae bacterium]
AAGFAVVVAAMAVPAFALFDHTGRADGQRFGGPPASSPSPCPTPALGAPGTSALLGSAVETGTTIQAPDGKRFAVVTALTDKRGDPLFTLAFRDQQSGHVEAWHMIEVPRGPSGAFTSKGRTWHFESVQLPLTADRILDVGIYGGAADRITVASAGHASDAHISRNAVTGWTFFWVERTAKPLPVDANAGPQEYTGPERLTITAYDAAGLVRHTVTGGFDIGNRMQNPRDNGRDPNGTPTPGVPCS